MIVGMTERDGNELMQIFFDYSGLHAAMPLSFGTGPTVHAHSCLAKVQATEGPTATVFWHIAVKFLDGT